jgi:tRNA (guanine-N7-)-methyltransferase
MSDNASDRPPLIAGPGDRFKGRRKGRPLRPYRAELMTSLLPHLSVPVDDAAMMADPASFFDREVREIWMETGFGGGEHLAWQAERNPDVGFIGCEPFVNGVASLLAHVEDRNLGNVRIHADDAREVLDALPDGCISRYFLLFPDPWPKKRHANRRFVQTATLDVIARLLKPGGEFRLGSDDQGYVRWSLMHLMRHPAFEWTAEGPADWRVRPEDWPESRYEAKAHKAGRRCAYLRFRRKLAA